MLILFFVSNELLLGLILINKMQLFSNRVLVPSNRRLLFLMDIFFLFPSFARKRNQRVRSSRVTGRKVGIRFGSETFRLPLLLASFERSSTDRDADSPTTLKLKYHERRKWVFGTDEFSHAWIRRINEFGTWQSPIDIVDQHISEFGENRLHEKINCFLANQV